MLKMTVFSRSDFFCGFTSDSWIIRTTDYNIPVPAERRTEVSDRSSFFSIRPLTKRDI